MDTLLNIPSELAELAAIAAESMGWLPLGEGAYLHLGNPDEENVVINTKRTPTLVERFFKQN